MTKPPPKVKLLIYSVDKKQLTQPCRAGFRYVGGVQVCASFGSIWIGCARCAGSFYGAVHNAGQLFSHQLSLVLGGGHAGMTLKHTGEVVSVFKAQHIGNFVDAVLFLAD